MCGPRQEMQQRYSPGTLPITNWKEVEFHCQWRRTSSATVYFICNCIFYQKRAPFSRHTVRFVPLFQRVFMQSYLFSSCRAAGLVLWFLVFIKKIIEKLLSYFVCSEESSSVQFAGQITTTVGDVDFVTREDLDGCQRTHRTQRKSSDGCRWMQS